MSDRRRRRDRPVGRRFDAVRAHAPRVPLGIGGRLCRDRARDYAGGGRLLRAQARCRSWKRSAASALAPKKPHFPAKAKSCIVLFMYGGVSQVDTFDPKGELTKHNGKPIPTLESDPLLKVRNPGTLLGSTRQFARHGQAGTIVSDLYPQPCPAARRHRGHPQHVYRHASRMDRACFR